MATVNMPNAVARDPLLRAAWEQADEADPTVGDFRALIRHAHAVHQTAEQFLTERRARRNPTTKGTQQ